MATLKCKMCGGTIDFEQGTTVCTCEYCGTKQTLPRLDDDRKANLYDRANHFRRNNEYDKAMSIYEQILNEDNTDAESYWSLVLCKYGIEYVEDPATHNRVPTVNRAQFTSVVADEDYRKALEYADIDQKIIYEEEAKAIDEIQKGILEISRKEEPFDVFICYKETDNNGRRTQDSVLANDLYHQLTQEGFKVFFSRITLEDKLGSAYEPYIFAALNSAKVMVVLGTKPEYFNAVWVKNEWSRYLALIKKGEKKMLIPAYKDMDPYDLPEEFSHLQAQDMTKLGFMQDLIRGIKKIIGDSQPQQAVSQNVVNSAYSANVTALLKRGQMHLEDGEWLKADEFYEEVLNQDAECSDAFLGKFFAENKVQDLEGYKDMVLRQTENVEPQKEKTCDIDTGHIEQMVKSFTIPDFLDAKTIREMYNRDPIHNIIAPARKEQKNSILLNINDNKVLSRAIKYADNAQKQRIDSFFADLTENLDKRIQDAEIKDEKNKKKSEQEYADFLTDTDAKVERLYKAAGVKKIVDYNSIVKESKTSNTSTDCLNMIKKLEHFKGYEDADSIIDELTAKAKQFAEAEEKESRRKKNKTRNKTVLVAVGILAIVILGILTVTVFIPNSMYNSAVYLMNQGQYTEAIAAFQELKGFKDSNAKIEECNTLILEEQYNAALELYNSQKYELAITAFEAINDYKDSAEMLLLAKRMWGLEVIQTETLSVGQIVYFGEYEGCNEWKVLDIQGSDVLLLSVDCVAKMAFDDSSNDWNSSDIKEWLNGEYYNDAFDSEEQSMIVNKGNGNIYILNINEVDSYLYNKVANYDGKPCSWWLRSPGFWEFGAMAVDYDGNVSEDEYYVYTPFGVRPALWINTGT